MTCRNVNCNKGQCIQSAEGYKCKCSESYTGRHCEIKVNHCSALNCSKNTTCAVRENSPFCICDRNVKNQTTCSDNMFLSCYRTLCQNGGTCHLTERNITKCECTDDFTGDFCDIPLPKTVTKIMSNTLTSTQSHSMRTDNYVSNTVLPVTSITKRRTYPNTIWSSISVPTTPSLFSKSTAYKQNIATSALPPKISIAETTSRSTIIHLNKSFSSKPFAYPLTKAMPNNKTESDNFTTITQFRSTLSSGLNSSTTKSNVIFVQSETISTEPIIHVPTLRIVNRITKPQSTKYSSSFIKTVPRSTTAFKTTTIKHINTLKTYSRMPVRASSLPRQNIITTDPILNSSHLLNNPEKTSPNTIFHTTTETSSLTNQSPEMVQNRTDRTTSQTHSSFVSTSSIGCTNTSCGTIHPCLNNSCDYGVCEPIRDRYICVCEENYHGNDCSIRVDDQDKDDVITIESAIIGALGVLLAVVVSFAIFMLYRRNRRGSVYISSSVFPRRRDTTIKKRYSSRDIHSELRAGNYFNPSFDCSVESGISRRDISSNQSNIYSPDITIGSHLTLPPSPGSCASGKSMSTSQGEWYDEVEVPEIQTIDKNFSPIYPYNKTVSTLPTLSCPLSTKRKTTAPVRTGLYRADRLEDIPKSVLASGELSSPTSDQTTAPSSEIFVRQDDGTLSLNLSDTNRSRTSEEFQTLFEEVVNARDSFAFNRNGIRGCFQVIYGADTGKSEA